MITLERVHIEEMRGIRKLDIEFGRSSFAISGPNGSGKSGVIDAIEFALTGQMVRLSGRGTKGISVAEHGPHVDKTKFPDAAFVELTVYIPSLKQTATITRTISAPRKPSFAPDTPEVRAVLNEVAIHPEIALSRREVLRFILIESSKRSEEVQTILKLEELGQLRAVLNTMQNKVERQEQLVEGQVKNSRDALLRNLGIDTLQSEKVLQAANKRRSVLGLLPIETLTAQSVLDSGLDDGSGGVGFNKVSAISDAKALRDALSDLDQRALAPRTAALDCIAKIESDAGLFTALQRHLLFEKGIELVTGPECPLCGTAWDDESHLRRHILEEMKRSEQGAALRDSMLNIGTALVADIAAMVKLIDPVVKLAAPDTPVKASLDNWRKDLTAFQLTLGSVEGMLAAKSRLELGFWDPATGLANGLDAFLEELEARPDVSTRLEAQTFLSTAQLRLTDYRQASRRRTEAKASTVTAKALYETYCTVMESELNSLYDDVQKDFSAFYRLLNGDDEQTFTAKLTPSEGRLDLDVNFYERGLFPPAAYHSEGHQDGMGVCLYLALMKRLFGKDFTLALLDDVVMSVDAGHRYQFCRLLKSEFPDTQFVITTHDRLWAEQMRSSGLVTTKTALAFHSWSIETGPLVESNIEIWEEIDRSMARGKVEVAAAALRNHLEYVSRHLADQLVASVPFRADGNFEMGELLPAVLSRMKRLWSKAAEAAQSWGNKEAQSDAVARNERLSSSNGAVQVEQWAVNKAVHYNEWANFGRKDFEPVVVAFRDLTEQFRCEKCGSWLYVTPSRTQADAVRCNCAHVNVNLKANK